MTLGRINQYNPTFMLPGAVLLARNPFHPSVLSEGTKKTQHFPGSIRLRAPWSLPGRVPRPSTSNYSSRSLSMLQLFLAPPPICFDSTCQSGKDAVFLVSLAVPLFLFVMAVAVLLVRGRSDLSLKTFDDPQTGITFEAPEGAEPARDRRGELAFRVVGWTPWRVEAGSPGEPLRVDVGPVGDTTPRTFLFEKVLRPPSQLVQVQLPRPLGIVFEEDAVGGRVVIAELIPGGNADRLFRKASLDSRLLSTSPKVGDVLRATSATNVIYKRGALLFGAQLPERTVVVYGADGQKWPHVAAALQRGLVADGFVTLVLERRLEDS